MMNAFGFSDALPEVFNDPEATSELLFVHGAATSTDAPITVADAIAQLQQDRAADRATIRQLQAEVADLRKEVVGLRSQSAASILTPYVNPDLFSGGASSSGPREISASGAGAGQDSPDADIVGDEGLQGAGLGSGVKRKWQSLLSSHLPADAREAAADDDNGGLQHGTCRPPERKHTYRRGRWRARTRRRAPRALSISCSAGGRAA